MLAATATDPAGALDTQDFVWTITRPDGSTAMEHILAAAKNPKSKMSKSYRTKLLAAIDYIEAAGPVVKVATDAELDWSTPSDVLPLAAEHPRKVAKLAETYGVTSSIGRLQKALDGLDG